MSLLCCFQHFLGEDICPTVNQTIKAPQSVLPSQTPD